VLAISKRAPCVPELKGQLGAVDPDVRAMAVAALLAHCDTSIVRDFEAAVPSTPEVVAVLAMHGRISPAEIRSRLAADNLDVEDASYLLVALGAVGSGEDIERIRNFVARRPDAEEGVRIAAVLALHRLRAPASLAEPFLNGIFESSKLALEWIVDVEPATAVRLMRDAVDRRNGAAFVKFARRLPLEARDIKFLENAAGNGNAAAAGILAQVQPAEKVVKLLSSPDRRVRSETATWAPANSQMSGEVLDSAQSPLPNGYVRQLQGDLRTRDMILDLLERAPHETRPWRARLIAATWRPQLRSGLLQLLEDKRERSAMQHFWVLRHSSP
jgi:hypothetical protein